jgi:hypothetical protein
MVTPHIYIPKELLHIILEYDGRIKYKKGKYVNIIHKRDDRYDIIRPVFVKKIYIINELIEFSSHDSGFYFEFGFDAPTGVGLVYDYHFSRERLFEICYYDFRNNGIKQIRTCL